MILASVFASLVLSVALIAVACRRGQAMGVCVATAGVALGTWFVGHQPSWSVVILAQSVLTCVIAFVCWLARGKRKAAIAATVGGAFLANLMLLTVGRHFVSEYAEFLRLREQYLPVSLASRLEYESHQRPRTAPDRDAQPSSSVNEVRIPTGAGTSDYINTREQILRFLYTGSLQAFIEAQGFGDGRSRQMRTYSVKMLAQYAAFSENNSPALPIELFPDGQDAPEVSIAPPAASASALLPLHRDELDELLFDYRMGYAIDHDHVSGFISHRMTRPPRYNSRFPAPLTLLRLELVSLDRHEEPRAYVADRLPQLDQLDHSRIRPLDEFEKTGLDRLYWDTDLVVDQASERVRMIGAIRAQKQCLRCHTAEVGELLGALTYELRLVVSEQDPGG